MINKKILIIFNFLFVFLFSGCSINLKDLDSKVGNQFFDQKETASSSSIEVVEKRSLDSYTYKDLSKEQKDAIDEWLSKNGYNRYGDSAGVIYAGGSPLFDEAGGETIDRFEYIMDRQPGILENIVK